MKKNIYLFCFTLLMLNGNAWAGATQKSFTPSKYVYPIMQIDLQTADQTGNQTIYKCAGTTPAQCTVDLADASGTGLAAITAAAQNVTVNAGTYTSIKLYTCAQSTASSTTTPLVIQGTTTFAGPVTYSTTASGMTSSGTIADFTIQMACAGALVTLTTPVVVTAGATFALSLLVDLTNVTWTDSNVSAGMGGCVVGTGGSQGICSATPLVVPYYGTGTPTFERYLIAHSNVTTTPLIADANAAVNFGIDPTGSVFYVGVQPYYTETSPAGGQGTNGGPDYNTSTRTYSKNADGSIAFQTGGSAADNRVGFTAFQRMNHIGTCKNELASSATWNYQAFKQ